LVSPLFFSFPLFFISFAFLFHSLILFSSGYAAAAGEKEAGRATRRGDSTAAGADRLQQNGGTVMGCFHDVVQESVEPREPLRPES